jgi:hypothetical protein
MIKNVLKVSSKCCGRSGVLAIGSNAALHWVLRDDAARLREVFEELFTALSHAELQQQQQ